MRARSTPSRATGHLVQLVVRLPLPSPVKITNRALAINWKLSFPLMVPPSQITTHGELIFPLVFFNHTACVEVPAVILTRHGTVRKNAPVVAFVKSTA